MAEMTPKNGMLLRNSVMLRETNKVIHKKQKWIPYKCQVIVLNVIVENVVETNNWAIKIVKDAHKMIVKEYSNK